jgi:FkbM family methyltransferase
MNIKSFFRKTLNFLHLDLTKNLEYDRLTKLIMRRVISSNSNCIDVGCHNGEIFDIIIKLSPQGKHFAFEPLPHLFENLKKKYESKGTVLPFALSDNCGKSSFHFVKNAPAYSGILKRKYDVDIPDIELLNVELRTLDQVIPSGIAIDFIKIDVEGGEFGVLKGGEKLLKKYKPIIIFECGLGASDFYGISPTNLYNFITIEIGLKICTLKSYLNNSNALSLSDFNLLYNAQKEYYFIAFN